MLYHHRFRDFFGTVLGICGVAFVRALAATRDEWTVIFCDPDPFLHF